MSQSSSELLAVHGGILVITERGLTIFPTLRSLFPGFHLTLITLLSFPRLPSLTVFFLSLKVISYTVTRTEKSGYAHS